MAATETQTEIKSIEMERTVEIDAPIEIAYQAVLDQLGPHNEAPSGDAMPMVLETKPGGRWFRDIGPHQGHLWGFVQAIKENELVELYGPMFMSYAATNNVQYRLTQNGAGTTMTFRYSAIGLIDPDHSENVIKGWEHYLAKMKQRAEQSKSA